MVSDVEVLPPVAEHRVSSPSQQFAAMARLKSETNGRATGSSSASVEYLGSSSQSVDEEDDDNDRRENTVFSSSSRQMQGQPGAEDRQASQSQPRATGTTTALPSAAAQPGGTSKGGSSLAVDEVDPNDPFAELPREPLNAVSATGASTAAAAKSDGGKATPADSTSAPAPALPARPSRRAAPSAPQRETPTPAVALDPNHPDAPWPTELGADSSTLVRAIAGTLLL